jgi:excinuclease ABC subunit C
LDHKTYSSTYRDKIPSLPGVYQYYDHKDELLYIGKAKDLKKRVSSYFVSADLSHRIAMMVKRIQKIEFTIVETEQDAFLLENNLIKEYKPRYNIMLRDDKTYPYIVIKNERFPRVFLTRKVIKDGSEYLGPYTSVNDVRNILSMLISIFPLRNCNLNLSEKAISEGKYKVCLEYHIKNCMGPCQAFQTESDYKNSIEQIRNILKSNFPKVLNYLKSKMNNFAYNFEFEKAQEFKEKIELLTNYQSRSTIVNPLLSNLDVFGYSDTEDYAFVSFIKILNGSIIQSRSIEIKKVLGESSEEILQRAIINFSIPEISETQEILLPFMVELPFNKVKITVPLIGDKKKLVDFAFKNAFYTKQNKLKLLTSAEDKNPSFRIMRTLKEDLKLKDLPVHIECFDNSNLQGTNAVSSIVVFREAKPSKKDYRFFNVKTVDGPDDFATMEEAVYRRYRRMLDEGHPLPNLIIIDGGKGQLSSAVKSLEQLGIYGKVAIVGIAKRLEEIYFPEDNLPLYINKKSESLKLIQKMRDEAHRFGITAHRNKRSKNFTKSEIDQIQGIGGKSFELLIKYFKSVKKIKEATLEDLEAIIGKSRAVKVHNHFMEK